MSTFASLSVLRTDKTILGGFQMELELSLFSFSVDILNKWTADYADCACWRARERTLLPEEWSGREGKKK